MRQSESEKCVGVEYDAGERDLDLYLVRSTLARMPWIL